MLLAQEKGNNLLLDFELSLKLAIKTWNVLDGFHREPGLIQFPCSNYSCTFFYVVP